MLCTVCTWPRIGSTAAHIGVGTSHADATAAAHASAILGATRLRLLHRLAVRAKNTHGTLDSLPQLFNAYATFCQRSRRPTWGWRAACNTAAIARSRPSLLRERWVDPCAVLRLASTAGKGLLRGHEARARCLLPWKVRTWPAILPRGRLACDAVHAPLHAFMLHVWAHAMLHRLRHHAARPLWAQVALLAIASTSVTATWTLLLHCVLLTGRPLCRRNWCMHIRWVRGLLWTLAFWEEACTARWPWWLLGPWLTWLLLRPRRFRALRHVPLWPRVVHLRLHLWLVGALRQRKVSVLGSVLRLRLRGMLGGILELLRPATRLRCRHARCHAHGGLLLQELLPQCFQLLLLHVSGTCSGRGITVL